MDTNNIQGQATCYLQGLCRGTSNLVIDRVEPNTHCMDLDMAMLCNRKIGLKGRTIGQYDTIN